MTTERTAKNRIQVTDEDYRAIVACMRRHTRCDGQAFLEGRLRDAEIVMEEDIPGDVVTLNTRALVTEWPKGSRYELTLVLPDIIPPGMGYESILDPAGSAVLGLAEGTACKWRCGRSGQERLLKVERVIFQPEAENRMCIAS